MFCFPSYKHHILYIVMLPATQMPRKKLSCNLSAQKACRGVLVLLIMELYDWTGVWNVTYLCLRNNPWRCFSLRPGITSNHISRPILWLPGYRPSCKEQIQSVFMNRRLSQVVKIRELVNHPAFNFPVLTLSVSLLLSVGKKHETN